MSDLDKPYLQDAYGVPFPRGSRLENLVELKHEALKALDAERLTWRISSSEFGWQRTAPAAALLELSTWVAETFEILEPEKHKYPAMEFALRELESATELCKVKLTPNHLMLDELAAVFAELALERRPYLYKVIEIAEPPVYEEKPISTAVERFEEHLRILEGQSRVAIASREPIQYPLDHQRVLQARALLAELDLRLTLTETAEVSS